MKLKSLSLLVMTALAAPLAAQAADSPHSFTANVSLTSNYIFRGISQSSGGPAIQGGFDYSHASGFYLGTWGSNVGWIEDFQGYTRGNVELDLYGGYRNSFGPVNYDVGALTYYYPGSRPAGTPTANTDELYASLNWKWFTAKYSHYISDGVFGFGPPWGLSTQGTYYLDLAASVPVGETGLTLGAHWGTFNFKNGSSYPLDPDYKDWKVSATYDMGKLGDKLSGVTVGVMYTDTNAASGNGVPFGAAWTDANGKDLGKGTTTVWISKAL